MKLQTRDRGNGMTEYRMVMEPHEIARTIKDSLLVLSVILPVVFGFVFTCQLLETGVFFLIYWAVVYSWLMLFLYANCRKRRDRHTGRRERSRK